MRSQSLLILLLTLPPLELPQLQKLDFEMEFKNYALTYQERQVQPEDWEGVPEPLERYCGSLQLEHQSACGYCLSYVLLL